MKALHQEWSRTDGELTFVVARKLLWGMLQDPNAFYSEFSTDTVNYERFAEDLDKLVFWNPNDTSTVHLERLRIVAIDRLVEQTYAIDSSYMQLHRKMLKNLRHAKPTHVE